MFELLALQIYASSGLLALMFFGAMVYFIFKFFNGDYSSTTEITDNGQESHNSTSGSNTTSSSDTINNKAPAERNYEGYIEHGDTILLKSLTRKNKKNRPNTYDCYDERWDDNTGHFKQLFTYEKPLTFIEPKHINTDSIHIEDHIEHIKTLISQYLRFITNKANTLNDYKTEKRLPIKVDSSIKQDKGWVATFAMTIVDCKDDTALMPTYDLIEYRVNTLNIVKAFLQ